MLFRERTIPIGDGSVSMTRQPMHPIRPAAIAARVVGDHRVTLHRGYAGLDEVWLDLARGGAGTVFQSPPWLLAFERAVTRDGRAETLSIVVDAVDGGRPVMALPLVRHHDRGLVAISFPDLAVADYGAPIIVPGALPAGEAFRAIWRVIVAMLRPADVLCFDKMPIEIAAGVANPLARLPEARRITLTASGVALGRPWSAARATLMSRPFLEDLDSKARRLAKRAPTRFRAVSDRDDIDRVFDALVAQRAARFAQIGAVDILADPVWRGFYRDLARDGAATGTRLFTLDVDGRPAATLLGFASRGTFHCMLPTFEQGTWKNYSPGLLAILSTMEWAAEQGFHTFDFTIGAERYKAEFGVSHRPMAELVVALSARALPRVAVARGRAFVRVRPRLASVARRLLRGREG